MLAGEFIDRNLPRIGCVARAQGRITHQPRDGGGERVTQAQRSHYYQQAIDGALTVPQVVGRILVVNAVLAGLAGASLSASAAIQAILTICGAIVVAILLASFSRAGKSAD